MKIIQNCFTFFNTVFGIKIIWCDIGFLAPEIKKYREIGSYWCICAVNEICIYSESQYSLFRNIFRALSDIYGGPFL